MRASLQTEDKWVFIRGDGPEDHLSDTERWGDNLLFLDLPLIEDLYVVVCCPGINIQ